MKRTTSRHVFGCALTVAAVCTLAPRDAAAAMHLNAYACSVMYMQNTALGSEGYVNANFYTGPSCTGTFLGTYFFCSSGATSSLCDTAYLYREAQLSAMFLAIENHMSFEGKIDVSYRSGTSQGWSLNFNP